MGERMRVATWNCFGVPGGLFGVVFGQPHLPERFRAAQIARALAAYDVVCIQESFLDAVSEFFQELAELLGMHLWHDRAIARVREKSVFGGGLAILANQALDDVSFEVFPPVALGFDAWATKGFATCTLKTRNGAPFRVVNLHLQADVPYGDPSAYNAARASQLAALVDGLDRLADVPTLLCGDLNVPEGSDEYHQVLVPAMRRRGFVDVAEGLGLHTYSPRKNALLKELDPQAVDMRVDYIWTSGAGDRRWNVTVPPALLLAQPILDHDGSNPLFASDHFGIGVELELD